MGVVFPDPFLLLLLLFHHSPAFQPICSTIVHRYDLVLVYCAKLSYSDLVVLVYRKHNMREFLRLSIGSLGVSRYIFPFALNLQP